MPDFYVGEGNIGDAYVGSPSTIPSTFGYLTQGTSGELGPDNGTAAAGRFTVPSNCGTVNFISAYLRLEASGTCPVSCAIFTNAGGNTIGTLIGSQTSAVNLTSTSYTQIDVPCNIDLTSYQGQEVWLFVWCDSFSSGNVWHVPYDLNAVSNTIYISWANSYNNWGTIPNTPNEAYDLAYPSIWAQYTAASSGAYTLTCAQGSYSLSGQAVTLKAARTLAIGQGGYTVSGQTVTLRKGYLFSLNQGSYTLAGQSLGLAATRTIPLNHSTYTLSGQNVNLNRGIRLTLNQGSYSYTGQSVGLLKGNYIGLTKGDYTLTGQNATLKASRTLQIAQGVYSLDGQTNNFKRGLNLSLTQGSYSLSGQNATLVYTPVGSYTIVCHQGSYTLSGQLVGLTYTPLNNYNLILSQGGYSLNGQTLSLRKTSRLPITEGVYDYHAVDVNLNKNTRLNLIQGAYTLNGKDVSFYYTKTKRRYFITS